MRVFRPLIICTLLACAPATPPPEVATNSSTTSDPATTGPVPPPTSTGPAPSPTSTSTTSGTTSNIIGTTHEAETDPTSALKLDLVPSEPCDIFAQDCPEGKKCTVWSEEGDYPDATRCVPISGDGKPGDTCLAQDLGVSGLDDCEEGAICWDLGEMGTGTCAAFCTGAPGDLHCPEHFFCGFGRVFGVCYFACDPLLQDCPVEELCIPNGDIFMCVVDGSGDAGKVNDPCEFANACDTGLMCQYSDQASAACDQNFAGCCQPFCVFVEGQPGDCPNPDQQCVQWFDPMFPIPEGSEDIGVCRIPE